MNCCLTEEDILNDILLSEKTISNNYSVALSEMSNDKLYKKVMNIFMDTKDIAREIFIFMYNNGMYDICSEDENKINESCMKYEDKKTELC
jgi:spore coat protein CotF